MNREPTERDRKTLQTIFVWDWDLKKRNPIFKNIKQKDDIRISAAWQQINAQIWFNKKYVNENFRYERFHVKANLYKNFKPMI